MLVFPSSSVMLCFHLLGVTSSGISLYALSPVNRPCIYMPTWQFDPATGDAYQVTNGGQPLEDPSAPTQAEVEEFHIQQSAQDYARRKSIEATPQINTGNLDAELKLAEVQQRLFSENLNPIERLQLESLSEKLAASLVGAPAPKAETADEVDFQSADDYKTDLAQDPAVQAALQSASENLSEEVNEAINEVLEEADELETQNAVSALQQIQQNPDWVNRGEVEPFANHTKDAIHELVGAEMADQINTINLAVSTGTVSRARAARTVMSNPALMTAMLQCTQAGLIQLGL